MCVWMCGCSWVKDVWMRCVGVVACGCDGVCVSVCLFGVCAGECGCMAWEDLRRKDIKGYSMLD